MRRYWHGLLCCAAGMVLVLPGCSGEPFPPGAVAKAVEVEQQTSSESPALAVQEAEAACVVAEPRLPLPIPETADAAVQAVLGGLRQNRPDVLWEALPASYQRDLSEIVHLFAARLNPEAWRWFLQIAHKGATV